MVGVFCMIRQATIDDILQIEDSYSEHFRHELEYGAYTVFQKNVYPTRADAEKAEATGSLYVYEENNMICGSIIINKLQPAEYETVVWNLQCGADVVMVIHLLMVRPSMHGKGIASALLNFTVEQARERSCKVIRLDTGGQNIPAISLYKKFGFEIVAAAPKKVGDAIEHNNHLFLEKML